MRTREKAEPSITSESIFSRLSQQLTALEKRDFEQWVIVVGTGILIGAGLVAILFPSAILSKGTVHFEIAVSRELFLGLIALLALFNTYIITTRLKLRRTRGQVISTAIQSELLRLQSFSDPLTEVYNRRALDDMMQKYTRRAERLKNPLSFLMIDVDSFREINSRFGHTTGDFVLLEVATILKSAVRGSDAVIRYGGDEFLIILADAPLSDVDVVKGRISRFVQDWNQSGHLKDFELVLSVGASQWASGKTADQIMDEADQHMYAAKARGKEGRPPSSE
jgi:diguanylate cyclase (GGDEF)-like protein